MELSNTTQGAATVAAPIVPEEPLVTKESVKSMTLSELARLIRRTWRKGIRGSTTNLSPHAEPYVGSMSQCDAIDERFYAEGIRESVLRFLCNAQTWRGEVARLVKAELNRRAKLKGRVK